MELAAQNLTLKYPDGDGWRTVLDDVTVAFGQGRANIVMGPSGCGKSSLLFLLSSLRSPTLGLVTFDGAVISGGNNAERVRYESFGFIFQQHFLIPYLTVMENVCLARHDRDLQKQAADLLERLGIAGLAGRRPHEISGGERQRVAIARALVKKPAVVFADEPTASLDGDTAAAIYSVLRAEARGRILVVATHDVALLHGDERIFHIDQRRLVEAV